MNVTENDPLIAFSITGSPVALKPLAAVPNLDQGTVDSLVINDASLIVSPAVATTAAGDTVQPGITVMFDATFGGTAVHVLGSVDPSAPSIDANASIGSFSVGSLSMDQPMFNLHVGKDGFHFTFSGSMSAAGFTVSAAVSVQAGSSEVGADVVATLLPGGAPSWLVLDGTLTGSVVGSAKNVALGVTGTGHAVVGGVTLGSYFVSFDSSGLDWGKLAGNVTSTIAAFQAAGGQLDQSLMTLLSQMQFSMYDIVSGMKAAYQFLVSNVESTIAGLMLHAGQELTTTLNTLYVEFNSDTQQALDAIAQYLHSVGTTAADIATEFNNSLGSSLGQIGGALNSYGQDAVTIAHALHDQLGATDADVADVLQEWGYDSVAATAALRAVFIESDVQLATLLRNAGEVEAGVLAAVTESYALTEQAVINDLTSVYSDVSSWVANLPQGFCNTFHFGC